MDWKGVGMAAVLLFVVLFLGAAGVLPVVDHNLSVQEHEPVEAEIQSAEVDYTTDDDGDRSYFPAITYEYTVDGETYTSSNVFPGRFRRKSGDRGWAQDVVDRYEPGDTVTVYHDPQGPGQAYLRNDGWPSLWYIGALGIAVSVLGGYGLASRGYRRRKQRHLMEDTPTEQARSLSIGPSEITGTAAVEDRKPVTAPFTDDDCVVAEYEVKQYDDDDDDGGSWQTRDSGQLFTPFYVDDGTGSVLVRPHPEATFDLDPEDWTTLRVDSSNKGPEPVREFVETHDSLDYPPDAGGRDNDRKYRQNLIRPGDSVYVFGTVQPRESKTVETAADNADRLVIRKVEDGSMREPMFLVSDDSEADLTERREWSGALVPVGAAYLVVGFTSFMFMFAPVMGLDVPVVW